MKLQFINSREGVGEAPVPESGSSQLRALPSERFAGMLPAKKDWLFIAAVFLIFYLPFLFGPNHAYLRINDDLDIEAVYNVAIGRFYFHPAEVRHEFLNGNLPMSFVQRLDWPICLLQLLPDHFLAYAINDVVVRLIAFLGMFCLARRLSAERLAALLAASIFAFSISLPEIGLTVAAIPAVVYLVQQAAESRLRAAHYLALLLLGWNSSVVFSGIFLLCALPILRRALFGKATQPWLPAYFCYAFGLTLGAAGLIYGQLAGPAMHRNAWILSGPGVTGSVRTFLRNQFSPTHWDFKDGSTPLALLYVAAIAGALVTASRKAWFMVASVVAVNAFFAVNHFGPVAQLRMRMGGLFKTFQFDRFFVLASFLIISGWVLATAAAAVRLRRWLLLAGIAQLGVTLAITPQVRAPFLHLLGKRTPPSFGEHEKAADYAMIRENIRGAPVLSVGLDPMAALMNGISVIDGYYNIYPLSYKARFRKVIAGQLELHKPFADTWGSDLKIANPEAYFDQWGSRLYTFVDDPGAVALDYCAAADLGARFVISEFDLANPNLVPVLLTEPRHLRLYAIKGCGEQEATSN